MEGETTLKRLPLLIVLISGAFVSILNQTLLATALPHIMQDLHLTENTVQWLQSVFLLVNGIMIPVSAFLIERFTTRQLFLTAIGSFTVGTLICAIATQFPALLLGRTIQGVGAGILMPLLQTILFLMYPPEQRGRAMGMFGFVIAFAPAIGPTLSGWLIGHFPWRSVFFVVLPIAALDFLLALFILKNITKQTFPKVDIISIVLSTLGFGGLLYGFSIAGSDGWLSLPVLLSLIVGAITVTFFIRRQFQLEQPILEFRVFRYRTFSIATVLGMIVFVSMIGSAIVLPFFMQNMLGFTPFQSGLVLLPGALMLGVMNPIVGRLFDRFGAKWLGLIGFAVLAVTTFMFTSLSTETTFRFLATVHVFRMLGMALVMTPVTTAGLNELPPSLIAHGTAMNNTMRQVAGAIGTALLVTVMTTSAIPSEGLAGMVRGVNMSFALLTTVVFIGLLLMAMLIREREKEKSNP